MIFWVAVIATVGHLPALNSLMSYVPMRSKIEHILHPHSSGIEDAEKAVVKSVFKESQQTSDEISSSYEAAQKKIKESVNGQANDDVRSLTQAVSTLSEAERKVGGTPVFYSEVLRDVAVSENHQTVIKKFTAGFEKSFVLAEFKKLNTVLLIPIVEDREAGASRVTVLRYTVKENPDTYSALSNLLTLKVQAAGSKIQDKETAN